MAASYAESFNKKLKNLSTVFSDVTACSGAEIHGNFEAAYCLLLQSRRLSQMFLLNARLHDLTFQKTTGLLSLSLCKLPHCTRPLVFTWLSQ
jgi:hypothetical protein